MRMSSLYSLRKAFFWILLPVAAVAVWLFALPNQPTTASVDPAAYQAELTAERTRKDNWLRTNPDSPVLDKATFKGLPYFAPNPAFRLTAQLDPFPEGKPEKLVIKLTDGSEEVYEKYGHASFSLGGQPRRLLVLRYQKTLTVLFRDATSGKETYGGGRYLDIDPNAVVGNTLVLDFNTAYSPYCAYNPTYACPLPPPENTLDVPVQAGERYAKDEE
jgi:uncharacterized protein